MTAILTATRPARGSQYLARGVQFICADVENGKSDITIGRLARLVAFYGLPLAELLPTEPAADPDIVRKSEQRTLPSPAERSASGS
jgi:hypothetical protein